MTNRLLTDLNGQLLKEVENLGIQLSLTQLERRRRAGFVPQTDGRRRGVSVDLEQAAGELVTLERFLGSKGNRSLPRAVLPMFFAGCSIREDVLKRDLLSVYDSTQRFLVDESRKYRLASGVRLEPGRPSRFEVAEGAACAYVKAWPAALRPLLTRMGTLSQQNQEADGFDVPAERPEALLVSALSHFFVAFLYGGRAREGWEVIPELLHMVGLEQVVSVVLSRFGVALDDDFGVTLATIMPALSLPALKRTVSRSNLLELETMRDDSLAMLATAQVFGQALPVMFGERAKALVPLGRSKDEYAMLAVLIPAVHNMQRLTAAKAAAETVRELQRQVPEVQAALTALDGPEGKDVDRRQLRRDVKEAIAAEVRRKGEEAPAAKQ